MTVKSLCDISPLINCDPKKFVCDIRPTESRERDPAREGTKNSTPKIERSRAQNETPFVVYIYNIYTENRQAEAKRNSWINIYIY